MGGGATCARLPLRRRPKKLDRREVREVGLTGHLEFLNSENVTVLPGAVAVVHCRRVTLKTCGRMVGQYWRWVRAGRKIARGACGGLLRGACVAAAGRASRRGLRTCLPGP